MSTTIDTAFVKQFESEVHLAYQRMGSKLLNTIRRKTNVVGESTTFQKIGKGTPVTKSRHGDLPIMDLAHTNVECTLSDHYAPELVDKLDELKTNIDERGAITTSAAATLGRKSDELITNALDGQTTNQTTNTGGITIDKCHEIFEAFGNNDVPDDGMRYMAVSPQGWTDLLGLSQFADADYIGSDELPYKGGMTAKRWLGFVVFPFSGLSIASTVRSSHAWHQRAVGGASGSDVYTDITWQGMKQAWLIVAGMSQGAVLIDTDGVYKLRHTES